MKKLTTEQFIEKAQQIHNQKYDYRLVDYKNAHTKVKIICPEHGVFEQSPNNHLNRQGCSRCRDYKFKLDRSSKDFIDKANKIHNFKYNYDNCIYDNAKSKIVISCPTHGNFNQIAYNHLQGKGCPKCTLKHNYSKNEFINKCKNKYGELYLYDNTEYINASIKIIIECRKHGKFTKLPKNFINGQGCPKCTSRASKPEIEVRNFIKSLNFIITNNDTSLLDGKELDIYIPELKKAIEFNGTYWHYHPDNFIAGKHSTKSKLCKLKNINLLHIREDLWKKDKEKMKKVIHKFLNFKN